MEAKAQLLIKHAVGGRTFVDSKKAPVEYRVEPFGEGWKFTVPLLCDDTVQEILRLKNELNVFIFEETAGRGIKKTWYYLKDGLAHYDEDAGELTLIASSRIDYYPGEYSYF